MILEDLLQGDGDRAYAALMSAHEGLTDSESHAFNARLILILMNEIGDADRFEQLLSAAKRGASAK